MWKIKKRWLIVLVFVAILSFTAPGKRTREVRAEDAETTEVSPYKEPTGDVRKFLGIWMTSGYSLQPNADSYVVVDNPTTLYTDQGRSFLTALGTLLLSAKYQWFESTDGKTWSKITKKNGGTSKNLTLKPTEVGTKWYQQRTAWYVQISDWDPGLLDPTIYSKVAAVHAVPEPTDATDMKVTTDDDYIYNSKNDIVSTETYARADVTPSNFTGTITWSVDNPSLATIDENTGLISANTDRRSGILTVTATAHNPIGEDIQRSTTLLVGGGLENQTVKAGKKATFDLRGNVGEMDEDEDSNYTVKWYKEDPITHYRTQLDVDSKALSITTPATTLNDDGTLYLAIISVKMAGKTYSYTTNDAFLYVTPEGGPDVELKNTLTNQTFDDGNNTSKMLFGVNNGDAVSYTDTVTNNSTSGTLNDATYVLPLRKGTKVTSVKVDGKDVDPDNYEMKENSTTDSTDLLISGLNFKIKESHQIDVETIVDGVTQKGQFESIPYIYGKDDDGENYQKVGRQMMLNYTMDTVVITDARDIDYGKINSITSKSYLARQDELNLPNNVIEIEDTRRNKTPVRLLVSQEKEFTNGNGDTLSGHLRFYDSNGSSQSLLTDSVQVAATKTNEALGSLGWEKESGILLYMDSKWNAAGQYSTKVNWVVEDSL